MQNTRLLLIVFICSQALYSCQPNAAKENFFTTEVTESTALDASNMAPFPYADTVYVPIYSDIYSRTKDMRFLLTATLSIRNTSLQDSMIVSTIDYYNTQGQFLHSYLDHPIILPPMATIEYVVEQEDRSGGSGANFIVVWSGRNEHINPLIQSVMISVSGQQGVAFSCDGVSTRRK